MWGAVKDGVNSVKRYFNNNFSDGFFDDCVNLAFNRVKMDKCTDALVLREKSNSFVRMVGSRNH